MTDAVRKNLLVTGATGKQGGSVISNILASPSADDFEVYAVTRNLESSSAQQLASEPKVKLIKGNLDDPEALFSTAAVPIWGVFSVQVIMGDGQSPETEEKQGKALIDAAIAHGTVEHFVYASADRGGDKSSSNPTDVPHFISKHRVEEHLMKASQGSKTQYTILRGTAFMDNLTNDFAGKAFSTAWKVALGSKPLQLVATQDIGYFAAQAFLNPKSSQYQNKAISLAGDSLNFSQANAIFQKQTGKPMPVTFAVLARTALWAMKDLGMMFKWFDKEGFGADIPALKQKHPGLMDFETWLQQNSAWKK